MVGTPGLAQFAALGPPPALLVAGRGVAIRLRQSPTSVRLARTRPQPSPHGPRRLPRPRRRTPPGTAEPPWFTGRRSTSIAPVSKGQRQFESRTPARSPRWRAAFMPKNVRVSHPLLSREPVWRAKSVEAVQGVDLVTIGRTPLGFCNALHGVHRYQQGVFWGLALQIPGVRLIPKTARQCNARPTGCWCGTQMEWRDSR